jgi:hypothetical protein
MFSGLPPEADIRRAGCDFRVVPQTDMLQFRAAELGAWRSRVSLKAHLPLVSLSPEHFNRITMHLFRLTLLVGGTEPSRT